MGREWFPLTFRNPDERWDGVNMAAPGLAQFLDAELVTLRHSILLSARFDDRVHEEALLVSRARLD